jgi:deazaflavin-dependent oxidoreductase (nitroreductase family)
MSQPLPDLDIYAAASDPMAQQRYNEMLIEQFRTNAGKVSGQFAGLPVLLLKTIGAKTRATRTHPLVYFEDGDRYIVVASKAGASTNPAWYHNLLATPRGTVELPTESRFTTFTNRERSAASQLLCWSASDNAKPRQAANGLGMVRANYQWGCAPKRSEVGNVLVHAHTGSARVPAPNRRRCRRDRALPIACFHTSDAIALTWVGLATSLAISAVAAALVVVDAFDI